MTEFSALTLQLIRCITLLARTSAEGLERQTALLRECRALLRRIDDVPPTLQVEHVAFADVRDLINKLDIEIGP